MARGGNKPAAAPKKIGSAGKKLAAKAKDDTTNAQSEGSSTISLNLQQKCLDIFRDALTPSDDDSELLQEVKGHLYNRDFAAAFGKKDYLRVYASRWSPSRALAYANIFAEIANQVKVSGGESDGEDANGRASVVCIGGGAGGELVGLGVWLSETLDLDHGASRQNVQVDLLDIANWHGVVEQLRIGVSTPPELSKYASQAKKDASRSLVFEAALGTTFHQLDVLTAEKSRQDELAALLEKADLVTFMFTLNELYSTSLPATQSLLNRITGAAKSGSHLLVVDSPGSYSTVSLNGAEKKYPMQWVLDHTLLGSKSGGGDGDAKWKKVLEDCSRWFRLSKELRYPIALEDMRYQIHLFRRT